MYLVQCFGTPLVGKGCHLHSHRIDYLDLDCHAPQAASPSSDTPLELDMSSRPVRREKHYLPVWSVSRTSQCLKQPCEINVFYTILNKSALPTIPRNLR